MKLQAFCRGKENADETDGVPIHFVIQMDLIFARFVIAKCMFEGIRDKLVDDQSTRDGFIDVQIKLTHIQLQLDLLCLSAEYGKKMSCKIMRIVVLRGD